MQTKNISLEESFEELKNKIKNTTLILIHGRLKSIQFFCCRTFRPIKGFGRAFISHPLCVAHILADIELDMETITAALLHDIVEDTKYTLDDIKELFGETTANLVEGVTKLGRLPYSTKEEQQIENFRKMFLAMAKDIRVMLSACGQTS